MRRRLLGRGRSGVVPQSYIDPTGGLFFFSFRQVIPEATLCLRQYLTDNVTFQDVGFIDGYVDTASIVSFANGTETKFEWYDQATNTLKYVKSGTMPLPLITDNTGSLYLKNGKIRGFSFVNERFIINTPAFPSLVNTFQVAQAGIAPMSTAMMNCRNGAGWIGAMATVSVSSPSSNSGTPTYWKNGVELTSATRGSLYGALNLNEIHSQHTARNAAISAWTGIYKGYNAITQYPPISLFQEELWYDASLMTSQQITDLELNQMEFYL